tara:strand:- start:12 stop:857 length:846 start_codon:yes stop_codon:yes gene_type:complete
VNILLFMLAPLLMGTEASLEFVEELYDEARYEDALLILEEYCAVESKNADCERLRAFLYIALEREDDARTAFQNWLQVEPFAQLGEEISPRLRKVFAAVKEDVEAVENLEISALQLASDMDAWDLEVQIPEGLVLARLTAHLFDQQSGEFRLVELKSGVGVWHGTHVPRTVQVGRISYYLVARFPGGVEFQSGKPTYLKQFTVSVAPGENASLPEGLFQEPTALEEGGAAEGEIWGMAPWAFWTTVGSTVALLGGGVATYFLTRDTTEAPGALVVTIGFGD